MAGLGDALKKIQATQVKTRKAGLDDLKRILEQSHNGTGKQKFNDEGYYKLFKEIFEAIEDEKTNFSKKAKASDDRLLNLVEALRSIVEHGVHVFRRKRSAPALVAHINQTLLTLDGQIFKPLARPYAKILRIFLAYRPHVDHLSKEEWLELVSLCIISLAHQSNVNDDDELERSMAISSTPNRKQQLSRSSTPALNMSFRSNGKVRPTNRDIAGNQTVEDFCACLSYLMSVPHQPVLEVANTTSEAVFQFLETATQSSHLQTQEHAFSILNSLLRLANTEAISTAISMVSQGLIYVKDLWHFKAHTGLKDQMLIFLLQARSFFPRMLNEIATFADDLQQLSDALFHEYSRRREQDILHIDDLILSPSDSFLSKPPMTNASFQLHTGFSRSEQAWTILSTVAEIAILRTSRIDAAASNGVLTQAHVLKKRKTDNPVMDILRTLEISPRSDKVTLLQLINFVAAESSLKARTSEDMLEAILPCVVSEDPHIANWAFMVASSVANNRSASTMHQENRIAWQQLWRLGCRALPVSAQCRCAAQLLSSILRQELVTFHDIVESIDGLLISIDLSGPTGVFDSTCRFWCQVLELKMRYTSGAAFDASQRVCQWFSKHWEPSQMLNRSGPKRPQFYETSDLILLLQAITGIFHQITTALHNMEQGILARTVIRLMQEQPLCDYLLRNLPGSQTKEVETFRKSHASGANFSTTRAKTLLKDVLEHLDKQIELLLHSGALLNPAANDKTSSDLTRAATTVALATIAMTTDKLLPSLPKSEICQQRATTLTQSICKYIRSSRNPEAGLDGVSAALGNLISDPTNSAAYLAAQKIAKCYEPDFWRSTDAIGQDNADDMVIIDDGFDSQLSRSMTDTQDTSRSRQLEGVPVEPIGYRLCQKLRIALAFYRTISTSDSQVQTVADGFIDYLSELRGDQLLHIRPLVQELFSRNCYFSEKATSILLQHIGSELLTKDEYERSEPAHCITLEILDGTVENWTQADSDSSDTAEQLYEWFVKVAVPRRILSPSAQIALARLLQKVMESRPDFGISIGLELPRKIFLRIFEEACSAVKFAIGHDLPKLFQLHILKEHDSVLDDIFSSLPVEPDSLEATAVRLRIMVWLGAAWPTLLRRCLYAMVEAPAMVPNSDGYAIYCFRALTEQLNLKSQIELYHLFAPQIIYTWCDKRDFTALPFELFGFGNLEDFLIDSRIEIAAQLIMRGKEHDLEKLSSRCDTQREDLLHVAFARAAAYCIGQDASIRPDPNSNASNGIVRLKKLLGPDQFARSVFNHFAEILSTLFKITDREQSFSRGLEKYQRFVAATDAYGEIMSSGASQAPLDVSQQPSFRSANLMDELEFLRSIVDVPMEALWTPSMYTYIFRDVVSMVHPALGSLYTCTVIRRLRILISIVGDAALQDYPLEMAMHALRGFVTDPQCSEDVIGICRYLLSHSSTYLQAEPSFLIGFAASTMVSLKAFMETPRDSTTQESDYIATMTRAREFHGWLHAILDEFTSPSLSSAELISIKSIADAASQTRRAGSSRANTAEGELLRGMILGYGNEGRLLINDSARRNILKVLCTEFDFTTDYRDDILGVDDEAKRAATLLLGAAIDGERNKNFQLWVLRVLGRAYAGSGPQMMKELRNNQTKSTRAESSVSLSHPANGSRRVVLQYLNEMLSSDQLGHVRAAERALHAIFGVKRSLGDPILDCLEELPDKLKPAFDWQNWTPTISFSFSLVGASNLSLVECLRVNDKLNFEEWLRTLCLSLISCCQTDAMVSQFANVIRDIPEAARNLFAPLLHMALLLSPGKYHVRSIVSNGFMQWMTSPTTTPKECLKLAINAILFLRGQPLPEESTKADRARWLDINYSTSAHAAVHCEMHTTALLFLEMSISEASQTGRRATGTKLEPSVDLLLEIYRNVDERDSFYGIQQPSTLSSMLHQLEFENAGFKSLSFRGAEYDGQIRQNQMAGQDSETNVVRLLNNVQLNGISLAMTTNATHQDPDIQNTMFTTARKLEKWDLTAPSNATTQAAVIFKTFQDIHDKANSFLIRQSFDSAYTATLDGILNVADQRLKLNSTLETLAILSEIEDVTNSRDHSQLQDVYSRLQARGSWMTTSRYDKVQSLDSCRQTIFGVLSASKELKSLTKLRDRDACILHMRMLLDSSILNRRHKGLQDSLNTATYLMQLLPMAIELGAKVDAALALEASHVLWDQGEMSPSIRMLEDTLHHTDLHRQDIPVGKPQILAILGHRISEARLEKPDEVIENYLKPAIKELKGVTTGSEAGQVFHEFAAFCDLQLQNIDNVEDLQRIESLRERKRTEVNELKIMLKNTSSQSKEVGIIKNLRDKAQRWFELDDREYQRLKDGREALLSQSLENYLLCLKACDDYDNDALRFSALWLEHYEKDIANVAVKNQIRQVPSRKLASLMNQWTSRQQDDDSEFQKQLFDLILRICTEHPFHGMYHIFTSSKGKGAKDSMALSRNAAANRVATKLKESRKTGTTYIGIHNSNVNFVRFASDRPLNGKAKEGAKIALAQSTFGPKLEQDISLTNIPPPTMTIPLRADCNYDSVPRIHKYMPEFTLASGISMPKILTAVASDGQKFKQLYKSGNDDLRQDAIMEQVFEQVSSLLKRHSETRQRDIKIRTYKVLPLTSTTGIIEFVINTIPLNNYLIPAHQAHHPRDLKPSECRRFVAESAEKSNTERVKAFQKICDKFHPVLRYFFTDRFLDPDDWFEKRLMYSRSTAAISMLGYVLGLGDRHGQNILLDEKTGEVVHIDLGIAFETGRVLPIPEVVPFRLTRDLVDGMGITGTEGVFRRCCEFMLEALRKEEYSIMTILDVLRYDPLYNWSVSPLRMKRLQEDQKGADVEGDNTAAGKIRDKAGVGGNGLASTSNGRKDDEADRALTVVRKKLSKSLSVAATVNELIQQATDPRNLAVLFAGWAAYL